MDVVVIVITHKSLSLCSLSPCSAPVGQPADMSERVSASALRLVSQKTMVLAMASAEDMSRST
jgi:hypothetical protein